MLRNELHGISVTGRSIAVGKSHGNVFVEYPCIIALFKLFYVLFQVEIAARDRRCLDDILTTIARTCLHSDDIGAFTDFDRCRRIGRRVYGVVASVYAAVAAAGRKHCRRSDKQSPDQPAVEFKILTIHNSNLYNQILCFRYCYLFVTYFYPP